VSGPFPKPAASVVNASVVGNVLIVEEALMTPLTTIVRSTPSAALLPSPAAFISAARRQITQIRRRLSSLTSQKLTRLQVWDLARIFAHANAALVGAHAALMAYFGLTATLILTGPLVLLSLVQTLILELLKPLL
jgi:hypothetical protein